MQKGRQKNYLNSNSGNHFCIRVQNWPKKCRLCSLFFQISFWQHFRVHASFIHCFERTSWSSDSLKQTVYTKQIINLQFSVLLTYVCIPTPLIQSINCKWVVLQWQLTLKLFKAVYEGDRQIWRKEQNQNTFDKIWTRNLLMDHLAL